MNNNLLPDSELLGSVTVVAVSKGQSIDKIKALYDRGCRHFAESYVQEAIEKIAALPRDIVWHFIGRIQSNKMNLIARHFEWVQSVDDIKSGRCLNNICEQLDKKINICMSINMDRELHKSGVLPECIVETAQDLSMQSHLILRGIMAIPKPRYLFEEQFDIFKQIRKNYDALNQQGFFLDTVSMGMSADYRAAIMAGSTMIRLGTILFGARGGL